MTNAFFRLNLQASSYRSINIRVDDVDWCSSGKLGNAIISHFTNCTLDRLLAPPKSVLYHFETTDNGGEVGLRQILD